MCRKTILSLSVAMCAVLGTNTMPAWAQEPSITLTDAERAERNKAVQVGTFKDGLRAMNGGNQKRAVQIWLPLAKNGHPRAQFILGYMYNQGIYFTRDDRKAIEWMLKAGNNDYLDAQQTLGLLLYLGTPAIPKDPARAAKWNKLAADRGRDTSQLYIGVQYGLGNGVPKNLKLAQKYLQMAVAQGNAEAAKMLAALNDEISSGAGSAEYQKGMAAYAKGDFKKARKVLERAAKAGDAKSQFTVGTMAQRGQGGRQSEKTAAGWFEKAATQNHPKAQSALGLAYLQGKGVKQDDAKAFALFQKSTDQDEPAAHANLGFMYANGRGVAQDYKRAVGLYEKAVEAGLAAAQFGLGEMVELGLGVQQSDSVAAKLYQMAVDQDYGDAMVSLGILTDEGRGVPQNSQRAATLFRRAADLGNPVGAMRLGKAYFSGRGVAQDNKTGIQWIKKGAEGGDPEAMQTLGWIYLEGKHAPKSSALAAQWYEKAAYLGRPSAQTDLGVLYEYGEGVTANANERDKWFKHASESGYAKGQYWRGLIYEKNGKFDKAKLWFEKAYAQGYEAAGEALQDIASGKARADYKENKKRGMAEARARRAKERGNDPWGFGAAAKRRQTICRANVGHTAFGYRGNGGAWRCP